jgi:hypothetical protein
MVVLLSVHPSRQKDLLSEDTLEVSPRVITRNGLNPFGDTWTRFVAPAGPVEIRNDFLIEDSGLPDETAPDARQSMSMTCPTRYCRSSMEAAIATRRS